MNIDRTPIKSVEEYLNIVDEEEKADNILEHANEIINKRSEEKDRKYGPMNESINNAAKIASSILGKPIDMNTVFAVMMGLKLSRVSNSLKRTNRLPKDTDSMLDCVAYMGAWQNYQNDKDGL